MIYAAKILKTDSSITVGAYNNKPLVPVFAFENKAEFDAEQIQLWQGDNYTGYNLIRVSRKEVIRWFGENYCERVDGSLCRYYEE